MNVLLIPIGSSGDVNPFVAIGLALQTRGHQVTMITNAHFEPLVTRSGFEFEPLGTAEEYDAVLELPDLWDPIKGFPIMRWAVLNRCGQPTESLSGEYPGETVVVAPSRRRPDRGEAGRSVGLDRLNRRCSEPTEISISTAPLSSRMPPFWNRFLYWAATWRRSIR